MRLEDINPNCLPHQESLTCFNEACTRRSKLSVRVEFQGMSGYICTLSPECDISVAVSVLYSCGLAVYYTYTVINATVFVGQ